MSLALLGQRIKTASTFCAILLTGTFGLRPGFSLAQEPDSKTDCALGKLLFSNVACVYFRGPGFPANSDGTLGGFVSDGNGGQMKIYEKFICRECNDKAGATVVRELHSYDKLGKIEQRSAAAVMSAWYSGDANDVLPSGEKRNPELIEQPSRSALQSEVEFESLAQQFQKAKDKDVRVVISVSQQRYSGKVIRVSAEKGLVHLKDEDGFNLYIVLAKVDVLLIP